MSRTGPVAEYDAEYAHATHMHATQNAYDSAIYAFNQKHDATTRESGETLVSSFDARPPPPLRSVPSLSMLNGSSQRSIPRIAIPAELISFSSLHHISPPPSPSDAFSKLSLSRPPVPNSAATTATQCNSATISDRRPPPPYNSHTSLPPYSSAAPPYASSGSTYRDGTSPPRTTEVLSSLSIPFPTPPLTHSPSPLCTPSTTTTTTAAASRASSSSSTPFLTASSKSKAQHHATLALQTNAHLVATYTVSSLLGYGSNGSVLGARRVVDNAPVAIKIIYKSRSRRVDREISILRAISHPNIVQVLDVWEDERAHFVVTERGGTSWLRSEHWGEVWEVPGVGGVQEEVWRVRMEVCNTSTLYEFVDRRKTLSAAEIQHIFGQVASAVAALHREGFVHGDLKEENILISSSLTAKLIDFGHARRAHPSDPSTHAFEVYGTHELSPPEMMPAVDGAYNLPAPSYSSTYSGTARGSNHTAWHKTRPPKFSGFEADVWALGLILYGMVHGKLPDDHGKVMRSKDLAGCRWYPGKWSGGEVGGSDLQDLVNRMLAIDMRERYTMEEVIGHRFFAEAI
ncbi:kinase-like protein [Gonapodya prolifera JEL478]|uniref:Kinase-like protein n=1 Tax=Gonapodya prolifera (strain JEL478) TaxID=1344416 RepID=A0A139AAR9_GONPJ|nr:kinase-like protein [Gonapodya prolifera JEL478]|eukprot:KXS13749.1 kinase-like protein [Gonapodya prolifera JEL478]